VILYNFRFVRKGLLKVKDWRSTN